MARHLFLSLVAASLAAPAGASLSSNGMVRVEDAAFARQLEVDDATLRLAGAGLFRWKVLFKVYTAAWYVGEGQDPRDVEADVPRRLEVSYLVDIEGPDFGKAAWKILRENHPPEVLAPLEARMEALHRAYRDVRPGDRYALTYLPGRGLELALNGEPLAVVPGEDFARVYFSIWLGERPISRDLRAALLGTDLRASR
jgi:hypothetical protein